MSKRLFGILLVIVSITAFHLLGTQPETAPIWSGSVAAKIFSDPVSVGDRCVFMGGDKGKHVFQLFELDRNGKVSAESVKMSYLPYSPIVNGKMVILADSARMIRGFSVPGLKLEWEAAALEQFKIPPVRSGENRLIVQSTANSIFCLDTQTGKPLWDKVFTDTLVNYAAGKVVICIHGSSDPKNDKWKVSALHPEDGSLLWSTESTMSQDTPLFIQNVCILSSFDGEIMIMDQDNGALLYRNQIKGLKAAQVLDETLIMLASGGSRIVCMSLMTGNSWSTTMQSGFTGAAKYGEKLLLLDKKNLRCVEVSSGVQLWRHELDEVYNAFPHRKGIFVTHKDSFFSRNTFGSYLETGSSRCVWMASGRSLFMRPLVTDDGDLLVSYDGSYRLMPRPFSPPATTDIPAAVSDPTTRNINFWKDPTASGTADTSNRTPAPSNEVASGTSEPASEVLTPTTEPIEPKSSSENLLDDGWNKSDQ